MVFLLDANVLVWADKAGHLPKLLGSAGVVPCVLAREVVDEVTGRGGRKRKAEHKRREDAIVQSGIHVRDISLGAPEAATYQALRSGRTSPADAGECQSIALAVHDRQLVFVTGDRAAGWLALRELEDRVRALPSYLRALERAGALSREEAEDIIQVADGVTPPSWW